MAFCSTLSQRVDSRAALAEAMAALEAQRSFEPDLITLFTTPHHVRAFPAMTASLRQAHPRALLLGCSAVGTEPSMSARREEDAEDEGSCARDVRRLRR